MTMENNSNKRPPSFGRVFWGVVFIAAAAAVVLNSLDFLPVHGISIGWFIVLVVMVIIIIASIPRLIWFGVFFPLAVIYEIVMKSFSYDTGRFGIWTALLIALLLSVGFSVLFHRRKPPQPWQGAGVYGQPQYSDNQNDKSYEQYEHVINAPDGSEVYAGTRAGAAVKYINTDNLERGLLEVSVGSMKVYFDNAKIPSGQATIELRVRAASIELYIPRTWIVLHQYENRLSGIDIRGRQEPSENAPHLILTGGVSISSLTIFYV